MKPFQLLITKKLSHSPFEQTTIKDVVIVEKAFIQIVTVDTPEIKEKIKSIAEKENVLVFTSKNALQAVASVMKNINDNSLVFCLDGSTRDLIIKYFGEEKIIATAPDAVELANKIAAQRINKALYFFCGNKRREELPGLLLSKGIKLNEVIVYETKFSPEKMTDEFDGVSFFSPSAAESFFSMNQLNENTVCFSIGNTTSATLKKLTNNNILTSEKASEKSMLNLVNSFVKKKNE
ncbi:MAG: uroporphyrinogen-III synthase [Flavitalea sp.]